MKNYILIAAAASIALSACTKEPGIIDTEESRSSDYFTATIEKVDGTRATFDTDAKCASWQVGDRISIDGKLYEAQENGTVTTFAAIGQAAAGSTHKACFPASLCDAEQNLVLPSTINEAYVAGRFNMPMYAQSTTKNLAFKNLCAVLKITIKNSEIDKVQSIKISSQSRALSGRFTVKDNTAVLVDRLAVGNTLEVTYKAAVTLDAEGKVFYFAVPADTYRDLLIDVSNGNDHMVMSTKNDVEIAIARNTIYPIVFKGNYYPKYSRGDASTKNDGNKSWVQLWEGGPRFATCNIGASSTEDGGAPYTWGGHIDYRTATTEMLYHPDDYKRGMDNLSGEYDTAIAVWGTNWRMPSVTEINGFTKHCYLSSVEVNGVGCYLFRGKGYYYVNCLILPKVYDYDWGHNQWVVGSYGDTEYWTSTAAIHPVTLEESANALNLNDYVLSDFLFYWNDDYAISRGYLRPVRPVLSEEADPTNGSVAINEYPNIAEWVQLWPGGPKFSNTHYEYKGQWSLTGPDDMAATHWGPDWRVATQEQMNELLKAARGEDSRVSCTLEYRESEAMYYFCFKGKDPGYTDNCLYLKATYRDSILKEVAAYYWSGTSPCEDCGSLMSIFWYDGQPKLGSCNWLIEGAVSYYDILPVYKN